MKNRNEMLTELSKTADELHEARDREFWGITQGMMASGRADLMDPNHEGPVIADSSVGEPLRNADIDRLTAKLGEQLTEYHATQKG